MWLIVAFAATGFLIGNLMAMSASSTVPSFLGLLFALLGGSLIAFLDKLKAEDRVQAGKLLLALTAMCLLGVYLGIFVTQHELLTPVSKRGHGKASAQAAKPASCREAAPEHPYLSAGEISAADLIERERKDGHITTEQAYEQLRKDWSEACEP